MADNKSTILCLAEKKALDKAANTRSP